MKKLLWSFFVISLLFSQGVNATTYNVTTVAQLTSAISSAVAGDVISVASGTYTMTTRIDLTKSGTSSARINLIAANLSDRPVFDFSGMADADANQGILLSGSYWNIKGIRIKGAGDNGLLVEGGSNNIIEFCDFYENRDSGAQLKGGAANNQFINCDSYYNRDSSDGNADGFSPKMDVGSGNSFKGCRAWQNSDDGWDGYLRGADNINTTIENSWCFKNGYLKDGSASAGNGNGFKTGGSDNKDLKHNMTLKNCISVGNRVKGYDHNSNRGTVILYNCFATANGTNMGFGSSNPVGSLTIKNTAVVGTTGNLNGTVTDITNNSWQNGLIADANDYESLDASQLSAARKADGSLPDITFAKLKAGSDLIDKGVNVGLPYNGSAPDVNCTEYGGTSVTTYTLSASVSGGNGTVIPTSGTYNSGTSVTLTATPNSGYVVNAWTGVDASNGNTATVNMTSNKTVTVSFKQATVTTYTLSASVSGGNGTITPTSGTYNSGTSVTLTATPNSGYQVDTWTGVDASNGNTATVSMTSNKTVTVSFKTVSSGTTAIYEAENATVINGVIDNHYAGYSGTGYVDPANATGSGVEWTVVTNTAGSFSLVFQFANGAPSTRKGDIYVNGTNVITGLVLPVTGSWSTYLASATQTVTLISGTNKIKFIATTSGGLPDLDYLQVTGSGTLKSAEISTPVTTINSIPDVVNCYPNPASSVAYIDLNLNTDSKVVISLYDVAGKLAKVIDCGSYSTGSNKISFDVSDLTKGLYIVKLTYAGQSQNLRLLIK
ncbi:MAG TPA: T9SS type A sorting domain-containing protein [Bacteroidales bacterium]